MAGCAAQKGGNKADTFGSEALYIQALKALKNRNFIIKINATKITPDMYIGKIWQLKAHYGVLIWLLVFLLSFIIGMLVEKKNHC